MKKVYLSKSKVADSIDVAKVVKELNQLKEKYDFEIVQYDPGPYQRKYEDADHKKMLACDLLLVIPPSDQSWIDDLQYDIGKGQFVVIDDWLKADPGGIYVLQGAYTESSSDWGFVVDVETNNTSDYTQRYGTIGINDDSYELNSIIASVCGPRASKLPEGFDQSTYKYQVVDVGTSGMVLTNDGSSMRWTNPCLEIPLTREDRVLPMLAVSLL
jgi:hypothetical protein